MGFICRMPQENNLDYSFYLHFKKFNDTNNAKFKMLQRTTTPKIISLFPSLVTWRHILLSGAQGLTPAKQALCHRATATWHLSCTCFLDTLARYCYEFPHKTRSPASPCAPCIKNSFLRSRKAKSSSHSSLAQMHRFYFFHFQNRLKREPWNCERTSIGTGVARGHHNSKHGPSFLLEEHQTPVWHPSSL